LGVGLFVLPSLSPSPFWALWGFSLAVWPFEASGAGLFYYWLFVASFSLLPFHCCLSFFLKIFYLCDMIINYITIALILFLVGVLGIVVNRKNLILMLMSIELMLLAINSLLLIATTALDNIDGQIFALYILVVAAAESAIGLSILVAYYRVRGTISVRYINLLRG